MEIKIFKSTELSETDWQDITAGFNEAFERGKNPEEQKKYYHSNVFGYSYHAICRNGEGDICGHSSIIPVYYIVEDQVFKFGVSGGSFVLKQYRSDIFLFAEMYNELKSYCIREGMKATYGVSNKNSFNYAIKILKCFYLKDLDYYILPVSISKILKLENFLLLDWFWKLPLLMLFLLNRILFFIVNNNKKQTLVRLLNNEEFMELRFSNKYQKFKKGIFSGIYRIVDESGIKTAYIFDFKQNEENSYKALVTLIVNIVNKEKIDAILFIGDLNLTQFVLFKIPKKKIPQRFPLTVDYFDKSDKKSEKLILDAKCWDFSLINFDVR